jgi:hypothetical protein
MATVSQALRLYPAPIFDEVIDDMTDDRAMT